MMSDQEQNTPQDPFPVDCLPGPLAAFVSTVAASCNCDPSFVALPVLTVCGAAIGNTARLRLKPGYDVPPIVWSVVVGESGCGKSPAFKHARKPLVNLEARSAKEHLAAMEMHKSLFKAYQRDLRNWEKLDNASTDPPREPVAPIQKRYYTSDVTIQSLAKLLSENPRGLILMADEIRKWFGAFNKYTNGVGCDDAHWLEMHDAGAVMIDRKGDGVTSVTCASVCVTGGIQNSLLGEALAGKHRHSGLSARLLMSVPPRREKLWTDAAVSPLVEAEYAGVIEALHSFDFDEPDDDGVPQPRILAPTPEAMSAYIQFINEHSREQLELSPELSSSWDKLGNYAARIALIFHHVRAASGDATLIDQTQVDEVSIKQAIRLTQWLKREAKHVHEMLTPSRKSVSAEQEVMEYIRSKGGKATVRQIQNAKPHLGTADEIRELLDPQANSGHGSWEKAGRTVEFVLSS